MRKVLPIEVDRDLCLRRQLRVNQSVVAVDFDIVRHERAVEFRGMAETSAPILDHVVGENYFLMGKIAYYSASRRTRIGDHRCGGKTTEVDYSVECFAGPLRGYFDLFLGVRAALKRQSDVQHRAGGRDSGIEGVGQHAACSIGREVARGKAWCRDGEPQGELDTGGLQHAATFGGSAVCRRYGRRCLDHFYIGFTSGT